MTNSSSKKWWEYWEGSIAWADIVLIRQFTRVQVPTTYLPTYLQCSSTTLGKAVKENAENFRYVCTIKMNKSTNLVLIIFGFSVFSNVWKKMVIWIEDWKIGCRDTPTTQISNSTKIGSLSYWTLYFCCRIVKCFNV